MRLYLVWILWKGSQQSYVYASSGENEREAIAAIVGTRTNAIETASAFDYPPNVAGAPNRDSLQATLDRGQAVHFRIRSTQAAEALLYAAGVQSKEAPKATGGKPRRGEGNARPWTR